MALQNIESRFNQIFNNKGHTGPIAEKAVKNFETIRQHKVSPRERLYYFAVGHALRNIDKDLKESIFEYNLDEEQKKQKSTQFTTLQSDFFRFENALLTLLKDIRNCNGHYVHTFDKLYLDEIRNKNAGNQIIEFLKEAFEFSILIQFLKEKPKEYEKFKKRKNENKNQSLRNLIGGYEKKLVKYLC